MKLAYPQGYGLSSAESPRNLSRWIETLQALYANASDSNFNQTLDSLTSTWDPMEKQDFKHWLNFYTEGAQYKYKTAQYLDIPPDPFKALQPDLSHLRSPEQEEQIEIADKIRAAISRLNSVEKIVTSPKVQKSLRYLDMGVSQWLEELHKLKRMLQLAPLRNVNSTLCEDLILRHSEYLKKQGFVKAAQELAGAASPAPPPPPEPSANSGEEAMEELIEGMNFDQEDLNDLSGDIVVEAQEAPPEMPIEELSSLDQLPKEEKPLLEITEDEPPAENAMHQKSDDVFDAALADITIHDVISRLESLANLFRTREIPRQLAIIDLMMNQLGISTFFPALAEASSKSLDSNQYALTRVEEILSKLRGAVKTPKSQEINLLGPEMPTEPLPEKVNTEGMAETLQDQSVQDAARKEQRKRERQVADELATPITNVQQDLNQKPVEKLTEEI